MFEEILSAYGLDPASCRVERLDSGLINFTWKITTGDKAFILQICLSHPY
jgi:hypothetical protein